MKWFTRGKYYEIITAVAIFIVLDTGVLSLNYLISFQIADDAHAIQLASRQSMLSQKILQQLYQVRDNLSTEDIEDIVTELNESFSQFDEALDAFIFGGELIGVGQGQDRLLLDSAYSSANKQLLEHVQMLWQPYRRLISPIIYSIYEDELNKEKLLSKTNLAIDYGTANNAEILRLTNAFTRDVETIAQDKAQRLRTIQAIGITLAIINFFIILFHFLRKLNRSDQEAEAARQEKDEILNTVSDGLFLLDKNFLIRPQYSASLNRLLGYDNVAGANFIDLLKPMVSKATLETTEDYLEVLFSEHVKPDLLNDLNPLNEIELHIQSGAQFEIHYFTFKFTPVIQNGELIHLLASVNDITEQVQLQRALAKSKEEASQQIEQLMSVLHIDPTTLVDFLQSLENAFSDINDILRAPAYRTDQYRNKLHKISRLAHRAKGDSAAVGLDMLESKIHSIEDIIEELSQRKKLSGNDFLPITIMLNELHSSVESLQTLITRFGRLRQALESKASSTTAQTPVANINHKNNWQPILNNLAQEIAKDQDKDVIIDMQDFDISLIPQAALNNVKDALIQLVRNAVVHGIEKSQLRQERGKPASGLIKLATQAKDSGLLISVRDDGHSIDLQAIKERIQKQQQLSEEQLEELTPAKLIRYLFMPGFSTASAVNKHAGRGVGLDLVKASLDACDAKLSVGFETGVYTEFKIRMPQVPALAIA